ncbi:hypothetical protein LTR78_005529 [Recurvomyces mirabilis]|uniref:Tho complex subunit 7 n=1 Tax=Recurvomyces mirabilis TaxID=574656 RepID=A0AAE1C189_9PEZI|nr:hypothetical protein LTR78_005529 [Recurvomyces mirabilis]KAK5158480.1 hypothetical protein LTS14_003499 [Recurvomyces mirabilis]
MATEHNYHYGVLPEQSQEDALHATRLLAVEERPFFRVQRALLGKDSLLRKLPQQRQLPSPPPEGEDMRVAPPAADPAADPFVRQKFREEVLFDFAALESSILRIQLIHSSNRRERERYAAEKLKITEEAQAVRENTVDLRMELEEAQKVRQRRKGYDALAAKVLDDKKIMSREACSSEIKALEKEIEELEHEGGEVEGLWAGRRTQFDRLVTEGEAMMRLVKGVKDEPEKMDGEEDENMEDEDGDAEGDDATRGESSRLGTPAPDGRTPLRADGGQTPMPVTETGDDTSVRPINRFLEVEGATRPGSCAASPARQGGAAAGGDVDMAEILNDNGEPPPQGSAGLEASVNQVVEPVEDVKMTMDET